MKRGKKVLCSILSLTLVWALALPARAAEPWRALEGIAYYGDRSKCAMTEEQARAFAERIETESKWENSEWLSRVDHNPDGASSYFAALFDLGNGVPALFFARAYCFGGSTEYFDVGDHSIWLYENGTTVPFTPNWDGSAQWYLHDSYVSLGYDCWTDEYKVYPFSDGKLSTSPSTSARSIPDDNDYEKIVGYEIDGKSVSEARFDQWVEKWVKDPLAYGKLGTFGMQYGVKGLTPVSQFKPALLSYVSAAQTSTRVTLHLNGGTGGSALWTNDSGTIQVPTNPTREGYTFGGWFTDPDLTVAWNFNSAVTGELNLYAKWVPVSSSASTVGQNTQAISFNGGRVEVQAYTLHADNGGDVTYVKLRDMAALLDGSAAQFNVDWKNGAIYVERGKPYTTRNGTELQPIAGTDGSYEWNTAPILFDGTTTAIEGIVLEGSEGSHTFLKLRDLANAIGFTVDWSAEKGITIEAK